MSKIILCFLLISLIQTNVIGIDKYYSSAFCLDYNCKIMQTKHNYLVLEFGDVKSIILSELISELESYDDKVAEVFYDTSSRRLTIYYTNLIKLDDLLQIVTRHGIEFIKVAGTSIQ